MCHRRNSNALRSFGDITANLGRCEQVQRAEPRSSYGTLQSEAQHQVTGVMNRPIKSPLHPQLVIGIDLGEVELHQL